MHILTPHHIKTHSLSFHTQIGFTILHALLDLSFETRNFDRPRPQKKKKNQKKLKMQLQVNLVVQVGQNSPHYKISNHSNKSFDKEKYQTKKEKEKES